MCPNSPESFQYSFTGWTRFWRQHHVSTFCANWKLEQTLLGDYADFCLNLEFDLREGWKHDGRFVSIHDVGHRHQRLHLRQCSTRRLCPHFSFHQRVVRFKWWCKFSSYLLRFKSETVIFECQEFIETYGGEKDKIASPQVWCFGFWQGATWNRSSLYLLYPFVIAGICLANSSLAAEPQDHGDFQLVLLALTDLVPSYCKFPSLGGNTSHRVGSLSPTSFWSIPGLLCLGTSRSLTLPGDHKPRKLRNQMRKQM